MLQRGRQLDFSAHDADGVSSSPSSSPAGTTSYTFGPGGGGGGGVEGDYAFTQELRRILNAVH